MKIAAWKTGHPIADTVANAMMEGLPNAKQFNTGDAGYSGGEREQYDTIAAYGILRGTGDIFRYADKRQKPWFNIDRGYFGAAHYDGYYRVSLRGTQQTTGLDKLAPDYERLERLNLDIKPWRGFDSSKPVLVCPPTQPVAEFFGPMSFEWWWGKLLETPNHNQVWREKGDPAPINFTDYNYVLTFNSSVGWQALQAGIPCISEPEHSIVGSWFKHSSIGNLAEMQEAERMRLFAIMSRLQLTLDEMRQGQLWDLIRLLISSSGMTPEKQSEAT